MRSERPLGGVLSGARVRGKSADRRRHRSRENCIESTGRTHSIVAFIRVALVSSQAVFGGVTRDQQRAGGVPGQLEFPLRESAPRAA